MIVQVTYCLLIFIIKYKSRKFEKKSMLAETLEKMARPFEQSSNSYLNEVDHLPRQMARPGGFEPPTS